MIGLIEENAHWAFWFLTCSVYDVSFVATRSPVQILYTAIWFLHSERRIKLVILTMVARAPPWWAGNLPGTKLANQSDTWRKGPSWQRENFIIIIIIIIINIEHISHKRLSIPVNRQYIAKCTNVKLDYVHQSFIKQRPWSTFYTDHCFGIALQVYCFKHYI